MKRLLIFDVDETLLSSKHDLSCFVQAFDEIHGLKGFPVGMEFYSHTTDMGIAAEIIASAYGRPATPRELQAIRDRYCHLLEEQSRNDATSVHRIPGARRALRFLRTNSSNHLVLATGAWASAAALKLRLAELDVHDLPRATSDDAVSRVQIVSLAIERAKRFYTCDRFDVTVLIGDGPWDLETARILGIEFVGIGTHLRNAGVKWVFEDLQEMARLVSVLDGFSKDKMESQQ